MEEGRREELPEKVRAWRREHPRATMTEIEAALDQEWYALRARLLEELAVASPTGGTDGEKPARPRCPVCGKQAVLEGRRDRLLDTPGGHSIRLRRWYATCTACGAGFFPPG